MIETNPSQKFITVDSCFGLFSPRQYSIMPQRTECAANASQLLQLHSPLVVMTPHKVSVHATARDCKQ